MNITNTNMNTNTSVNINTNNSSNVTAGSVKTWPNHRSPQGDVISSTGLVLAIVIVFHVM